MISRWRAPIATAVAMAFGILVLASLFVPAMAPLRSTVLGWAILLAAVALLLGMVNLFQVHFHKIRQNENSLYSFVLLAAMLVTFIITLIQGRQGLISAWLVENIQLPLESSLMAVLVITLTIAAARMLQQRTDLMSVIFLITLFIVLLGAGPLFGLELPIFTRTIGPYVTRVLSSGAARGLLIGVGLGTLATGLRILMGADRPFGG